MISKRAVGAGAAAGGADGGRVELNCRAEIRNGAISLTQLNINTATQEVSALVLRLESQSGIDVTEGGSVLALGEVDTAAQGVRISGPWVQPDRRLKISKGSIFFTLVLVKHTAKGMEEGCWCERQGLVKIRYGAVILAQTCIRCPAPPEGQRQVFSIKFTFVDGGGTSRNGFAGGVDAGVEGTVAQLGRLRR